MKRTLRYTIAGLALAAATITGTGTALADDTASTQPGTVATSDPAVPATTAPPATGVTPLDTAWG
jgi:hypothetical protein